MEKNKRDIRTVDVELATIIGLNEAMILQQIQYWIDLKNNNISKYQDSIKDNHLWVYNSVREWQLQFPFWSYNTVKRTLLSLEKQGLVIVGCYNKWNGDKSKWYRINYDKLDSIIESNHKDDPIGSKWANGLGQNEPTNTKDYIYRDYLIKGIKGNCSEKTNNSTDFSFEILDKQILKSFKKFGLQGSEVLNNIIRIFHYYCSVYYDCMGDYHPIISNKSIDKIIELYAFGTDLVCGCDDSDVYEVLIDKHFETEYKNCDYNICHFMSEEILNHRYYETLY